MKKLATILFASGPVAKLTGIGVIRGTRTRVLITALAVLAVFLVNAGTAFAYPWGQCTWYAQKRRPDLPGTFHDAMYWATDARRAGFLVSTAPAPATIVVFQPHVFGAGSVGHVAYVESVSPNHSTMRISEMNFCGLGCRDERTLPTSDGNAAHIQFIYWNGQPFPYAGLDVKMIGASTGYWLDMDGTVRRLDGTVAAANMLPPSLHIASGLAIRSNGSSGYVLDGWGGVHPFGGAPDVSVTGYWPNWDIARGSVLLTDTSGEVLDGWGGIHPFGGAPSARITAYWPGWDIARSIALLPNHSGGYVLDGWGGVHPFAVGSNPMPPPIIGGPYWPNWDIARSMALNPQGSGGEIIDGWGGLHPFTITRG